MDKASSTAPLEQAAALGPSALAGALAARRGAFALHWQRSDGVQIAAVDRFAQQSLCYRLSNGQLQVATRADALGQSNELDPQALFDYLYFHMIPSPRTVYRGVYRLPPGHFLWFEHGKLSVQPYWQPNFQPQRDADFASLKKEFRHLLERAVGDALDDGRPACFLSGGTDSSTVAGLVQQLSGSCDAFSIGFEAEGYDEMAYARVAAKRYGLRHHEYYVTPADLAEALPTTAAHFDQPFGNSSALPSFYCAREAQRQGVRRILAGDGGDELFGGNARYAKNRVFGYYAQVPSWLKRGLLEPLLLNDFAARTPLLRKGRSYIQQASAVMPDKLESYNLLLRLGLEQALTPDFLGTIDRLSPQRQQREVWQQCLADDELNTNLAFDWRYTLAENDLVKVRGACEMAGIDVAWPLLDDALLDFSLRLPLDYKLRGQQLRWFFKEALRGFLPDEIIGKTKHGFGLPFGPWLARHATLQQLARDGLHSLASRGLLRADFIDRLLRDYLPQHPGYYGEMVWIALSLELWLQGHAPNFRL